MNVAGDTSPSNLEPVSNSHLVELSVVAPQGQEQIGEDMKNFAEQLKPYPFHYLAVFFKRMRYVIIPFETLCNIY